MTTVTMEQADRHVRSLARKMKVKIKRIKSLNQAQSDPLKMVVQIPPTDSPLHYFVALHELGHLADPNTLDFSMFDMFMGTHKLLRGEVFANKFAIENSLLPVDETILSGLREPFGRYYDGCLHDIGRLDADSLSYLGELLQKLGIPKQHEDNCSR